MAKRGRRSKAAAPGKGAAASAGAKAGEAAEAATDGATRAGGGFWRDTVVPLLAVLAVVLPLRSAVADWNDVPSGSMRPTILEGDRIWVNKLAYGLRLPFTMAWLARWDAPRRGEIVTLASPENGVRLVKRIVGLPGDRISMQFNRLVVNGEPVPYEILDARMPGELPDGAPTNIILAREGIGEQGHPVLFTPVLASRIDHFEEIEVPPDHYFFMGDNRDQSRDSRILGMATLDQIYGRVTHVALSVDPERWFLPRFDRWFLPLGS